MCVCVFCVFLCFICSLGQLKMITKYLSLDSSLIVRNESAIKQLNDPLLSQVTHDC